MRLVLGTTRDGPSRRTDGGARLSLRHADRRAVDRCRRVGYRKTLSRCSFRFVSDPGFAVCRQWRSSPIRKCGQRDVHIGAPRGGTAERQTSAIRSFLVTVVSDSSSAVRKSSMVKMYSTCHPHSMSSECRRYHSYPRSGLPSFHSAAPAGADHAADSRVLRMHLL